MEAYMKRKNDGLYLRNKTYWMNFCAKGRYYKRSTGTSDRKLAESILGKIKTEIIEGKWFENVEAKQHTFDEMMQRAMAEHVTTLEPSTRERYRAAKGHLDKFFSGLTLDRINADTILQYVEYRKFEKCKPATRNREVGLLSKAFNLARL